MRFLRKLANFLPWRRHQETSAREGLTIVRDEVNRLFDWFFEDPRGFDRGWSRWSPALEVDESQKEYVITAEVPGLGPGDLEVTVTDGTLVLRGEKQAERERSGAGYHWSERRYGAFLRSLPLPPGVEVGRASARLRHGVLTIRLPKSAEAQAAVRRIPVKRV